MFNIINLAIHGGWSDWINDTECIKHGNDTNVWLQQMSRYCNNPVPAYGGTYCLLENGILQFGMYYCIYWYLIKMIFHRLLLPI